MLVLPLALRKTGLLLGVSMLLVIWCMSFLSLLVLLRTCEERRCSSLVDLCRDHGPYMSLLADCSVVLYFYGTCISYLILIGGTFSSLIRTLIGTAAHPGLISTAWMDSDGHRGSWMLHNGGCALLCVFTICVMLPLSCRHDLGALGCFSVLVVTLYVCIALAVWHCDPLEHFAHSLAPPSPSLRDILSGAGTMAYCFASQAVFPPALEWLQTTAKSPAEKTENEVVSRRLVCGTFFATLAAYLSVGVGGFVHGPTTPPPNVLDGCRPYPHILFANMALICCLSLSFPLMLIVARLHFLSLAQPRMQDAMPNVTLGLILLALGLAIGVPQVDVLISLMGGTCAVALSWIIPACLYHHHVIRPRGDGNGNALVAALVLFGAAICLLTTPPQLYDISTYLLAKIHEPHASATSLSTSPSSSLASSTGRLRNGRGGGGLETLPVTAATRRSYSAILGPARTEVQWLLTLGPDGDRSSSSKRRSRDVRFSRRRGNAEGSPSVRAVEAMRAWRDFLPHARVVGLNADADAVAAAANESRIAVHAVDSTDGKAVAGLNISSDLDVVVDAARRSWRVQQRALVLLWPHLRESGLYFIEHLSPSGLASIRSAERQSQRQAQILSSSSSSAASSSTSSSSSLSSSSASASASPEAAASLSAAAYWSPPSKLPALASPALRSVLQTASIFVLPGAPPRGALLSGPTKPASGLTKQSGFDGVVVCLQRTASSNMRAKTLRLMPRPSAKG